MSYSTANGAANWGSIRLEGDDDLTVSGSYVRNVGMGIEGIPTMTPSGGIVNTPSSTSSKAKRSSARASVSIEGHRTSASIALSSSYNPPNEMVKELAERRERQVSTTLALLRTFHAHTAFQLSQLQTIISRNAEYSTGSVSQGTIYLTPKDILSFELGALSSFDVRYLGWLVAEYATDTRVVVKRSWRDLFGMIFGYG